MTGAGNFRRLFFMAGILMRAAFAPSDGGQIPLAFRSYFGDHFQQPNVGK